MMKRIMLIVALGVSFVAPAAFAGTAQTAHNAVFSKASYDPCSKETGEVADPSCYEGSMLGCNLSMKLYKQTQDEKNHTLDGVAVGSSSANPVARH